MKYVNNILQDEIRCGFLVTSDRKRLWQVELELLLEFDRVCRKYDLMYFADCGTLLGAIRHEGFIPWDDDIDVSMPRPDYNKLCQIAVYEFKEPYFFQNIYTDDILMTISKLRRSDTAAIDDFSMPNYNQGIFLDIWPWDIVADGTPRSNRIDEIKKLLIGATFQVPLIEDLLNKNEVIPLSEEFLRKFMAMSVRDRFREFEEFCGNHFFESTMIRCQFMSSRYGALNRDWCSQSIRVPFENVDVPVPIGYEKILEVEYGDWHKFVRGTQDHQINLFSPDISYYDVITAMRCT